ncbi:stress enhanced protein 2, chloroplastic [Rhodamnia argentea]|uniref:Stress enhanced protein 2, chloroplastic n=1 Tax=Rhodamnia argentea TaxID=178133 RepID=A0A8B8PJL1_9MYRT|nr:stress enhanced protein 2, chloroplastic [Rhodamnia argentea]
MATAARAVHCQLPATKQEVARREPAGPVQVSVQRPKQAEPDGGNGKIQLQPRLCNLRSYGSDPVGIIKSKRVGGGGDAVSPFFETLSEYIESSKKSQDFEIISGRLAMIVFAATVAEEAVTGNSLFRKMDVQGIAEAAGVCFGAVACAAFFAWFSSARTSVGRIFSRSCNTLIDSLVDQIVDGLFYEGELSDWSDEI